MRCALIAAALFSLESVWYIINWNFKSDVYEGSIYTCHDQRLRSRAGYYSPDMSRIGVKFDVKAHTVWTGSRRVDLSTSVGKFSPICITEPSCRQISTRNTHTHMHGSRQAHCRNCAHWVIAFLVYNSGMITLCECVTLRGRRPVRDSLVRDCVCRVTRLLAVFIRQ